VLAEDHRKALLRVADQLSLELGYEGEGEVAGERSGSAGVQAAMVGILNSEDEQLVAELRRGLARVAAALDGDGPEPTNGVAVGATLDGAEMVMRGELVMGNGAQLPVLLPSFVFLVTLPVVDQDKALELSRRCQALVEEALG
jgi:hypothetical protein